MSNTSQSYNLDPYLKTLQTAVVEVSENQLVLVDTIFYPTGGGQPGDTGYLMTESGETLKIMDTRRCRESGRVLHFFEEASVSLKSADRVTLQLDWDRRYAHMRMHTCLHLLCAVIPESVTGGGMTDQKGRLDFCLQNGLPDKQELTDSLNSLIERDLPVTVELLDESILDDQPELVKTMSVQPPRGTGLLRMIRVHETDFQPCGGTHVVRTGEIGRVRVAKVESKGKQNKRVQIVFDDTSGELSP
ncbi:alanyl-tRNA editing protein [Endozoicomonas arenosclerae]|uniref:alanyl-tRNA editing protein n=1 Tax=Endozoicomonas arenosclerae TaxID=1633495 RepID=UPI000783392A|nr:alanyl-tRNA editing protein [Endozoicomonas arenosclerae]